MSLALLPDAVVEDRYVVVRALKTGGMGAIYEAVDKRLGDTPCALKELLTRDLDEDQLLVLRKFEEEMRILASLNHPGIPRVRDYFMHDGTRYIVMDLIDGQNLEELLNDNVAQRGRPLLPTQVVAYALQILDVLQYLHGHFPPIIHRDLKPANVILEKSSQRIKVVDFGLARTVRTNKSGQTAIASLGYAPLEQIQGRATVRSDLYGLGATMYHLLTGAVPLPMDAGPIQDANPEIDDELARIVDKATAVDENERFNSAGIMAEALNAWREGRNTGLPRRRPRSRTKTQTRLTRKTLTQTRPKTSELEAASPDIQLRLGELVTPATPSMAAVIERPRPAWLTGGRIALSVVGIGIGLWLSLQAAAKLGSNRALGGDHVTYGVLASPSPVQRDDFHLEIPQGWEVVTNGKTLRDDRYHLVLHRNDASMDLELYNSDSQASKETVAAEIKAGLHRTYDKNLIRVDPPVGVRTSLKFVFQTRTRQGVVLVHQDLKGGHWRVLQARLDAPLGDAGMRAMKELQALYEASELH